MLIVLHLLLGVAVALAPRVNLPIATSSMIHEQGAAYLAPLRSDWRLLYGLPADSLRAVTNSLLRLHENGKDLGPAHAPHAEIRDHGEGRFSHWGEWIRFSTSDGSDPRTNGRVYSVSSPTTLRSPWLIAVGVLDLGLLIAFRGQVLSFLRSRPGKILLVASGIGIVALAALAALGVFGSTVIEPKGAPKDAALVVSTLGHACIGCVVSLAAWAAGAGLVRAISRDPHASLGSILIPAFPVGLLALTVFVGIALLLPQGRILATVLWLICLLPLLRWRPRRTEVTGVLTALSAIVPLALLFGAWMGLHWHGPTATLTGLPTGDLSYYASSIWSLAARPNPYINLGYEGDPPFPYFNVLFSGSGAIFAELPGFDPFLFIAAGGAASFILLSATMLHLYLRDRARARADAFAVLILALSIIGAAGYPSWVILSVPVAHVSALSISVWWLASGRGETGTALLAMAAGLIGSALSKVATASFLVPLGAAGLWPRLHRSPPLVRALFFGIAGLFAVYSASMLASFLTFHLKDAPLGAQDLLVADWERLLRNAGMVGMAALAWRIAERPIAVAITLGLGSAVLYPRLFFINFICAALVLGLIASARRERLKGGWAALALLAFACPLPAALLTDPTGTPAGIAWMVCLGGATLAAIATSVRVAGIRYRECLAVIGLFVLVTSGAGAFGLWGVARGNIIIDLGAKGTTPELTPAVRDIWIAVRRHAPFDALIFTDQVADTPQGQTPLLLRGWNTYAFAGQRQIYISSHYTTFDLRFDAAKRREVILINDAVLRGAIAPSSVSTRRHYGSFFAVVRTSRRVPLGWQKVYQNSEHSLYSIPPGRGW